MLASRHLAREAASNPVHPSRDPQSGFTWPCDLNHGLQAEIEIIEALGLSVTSAAQALGATRAALSAVLNERAHVSPEMALRIEKAFGACMDTLMRMQNSYDIAEARRRAGKIKVVPFKGKPLNPQSFRA